MDQTKITVKVHEPLLKSFGERLESCFIKRDAFLNHMIKSETRELKQEMKGLKLSKKARLHISRELQRLGTKTINVVVDKDTAEGLNSVVKKANMVRDAFINRLILFLNAPEQLLKILELPAQVNDRRLSSAESISTSPLRGIQSIIFDPLFYLRTAPAIERGYGLYRITLPQINLPSMVRPMTLEGMSCYIDDSDIRGTAEWKKKQKEDDEFEMMTKLLWPTQTEEGTKDAK